MNSYLFYTVGFISLLALIAACSTLAIFLSSRAKSGDASGLEHVVANLTGQLQILTTAQIAAQNTLDDRLVGLTERLQDGLLESSNSNGQVMKEVMSRLTAIDTAQSHITEISRGVVDLQDVLSNKQARGAFGELQLVDLVKSSMAPSQYTLQATLTNGKRVDCLLNLPQPSGSIAIDAKFPLEAYRALRAAKSDEEKTAAGKEFTSAIRAHIKAISEKYIVPGETADGALMFIPSEAVFAELHGNFPGLVDDAMRAKVWIVSPTTMMATLTTMRAIMKDVRMKEQAHAIQSLVASLKIEMERLDTRALDLQKHYDQGIEDLRKLRISVDKAVKRMSAIDNVGLDDPAPQEPGSRYPRAMAAE